MTILVIKLFVLLFFFQFCTILGLIKIIPIIHHILCNNNKLHGIYNNTVYIFFIILLLIPLLAITIFDIIKLTKL